MIAQVAPAAGLRMVSASAGSGKTYRLTQEVTRAVDPSSATCIALPGLVGVTYTTKAHAELEARIRRALVQTGAHERAQQLPLAYVGTVHSVCLRLLQEFALDAGLSPVVDVIPGNEARRLLQAALEHALDPTTHQRLHELGLEFQLQWDARTSRYDWVTPVDDIMTLARSNRISATELPRMAERSIAGLLELLPPPAPSGEALEAELAAAVRTAIDELAQLDDRTKQTRQVLAELQSHAAALASGGIPWVGWARLAKLVPARRAQAALGPVWQAAAAYERHPRFRAHLTEFTRLLFDAARVGLDAYSRWKSERGLVDYVDMIDRALDVLDESEVAAELRARLQLVVVDEFQDTSPIQLALFTRLHALCGNSVWVGDRKQCIFEYAGADPALMEAATTWIAQCGGRRELLTGNYRSRPELVEATSTLFAGAFARHGYQPEEVVTAAQRPTTPELEALTALGIWWLQGNEASALARGIHRLLQTPGATPVLDRHEGRTRPLQARDIAVLVYSNLEAARVSVALEALGVATVLPRVGLLTTPEGTLLTAALRFLVDARDSLACAELTALTGFDGRTPDEWLAQRIRTHRRSGASPEEASDSDNDTSPVLATLDALRAKQSVLSPTETVDRVLALLDVPALAARWPAAAQRLANLDALRALAVAYEERCAYQREAASLAGLLRYFQETQQKIRQRDEERATDEQHVAEVEDAVVISTYHKAKGLEWPVVVLGSLARRRKRDAFEVTPESDRRGFDATDPLGGRWIRYWPWPLGQQRDVPLAHRAAASPAGQAVAASDARERIRLLYVGCTRARDHLILGIPLLKKGPSKAWLDELCDEHGPLLELPAPDAPEPQLQIRGPGGERLTIPVRAWSLDDQDTLDEVQPSNEPRHWFAPAGPVPATAPAYRIIPSSASAAELEVLDVPDARVLRTVRFTTRMPFTAQKGMGWDQIGTALHAFLAADDSELHASQRTDLAVRVLRGAGLAGFAPNAVLAASDALRTFVAEHWPDAVWHREIPVTASLATPHGKRRIQGTIDVLLETPNGCVIVDHKSFPGKASEWASRALGYAPQLLTYAKAVEMAGKAVIGCFVHFTIGGGVVEIGEVRP